MDITIFDISGLIGIACVLCTFFLVQANRMSANASNYQLWNMLGCVLILLSLYQDFNLPSVIIQIAWFFISLYGFLQNKLFKRVKKENTND